MSGSPGDPIPIDYKISGNRRSLNISKIVDMEVENVKGPDGSNSAIQTAPFAEPLVYVEVEEIHAWRLRHELADFRQE